MKKIRLIIIGLALALTGLSLPVAAQAAEVYHSQFRGDFASSDLDNSTGCISTFLYISAGDGRAQFDGQPELSSGASIYIDQWDNCTGLALLAGSGYTSLDAAAFQLNASLKSATLHTTMVVTDWVSGNSIPVDIALTWTGTGAISRYRGQYSENTPDFTYHSRYSGTYRTAELSGSVMLNGTNLASGAEAFGYMVRDGSTNIWADR